MLLSKLCISALIVTARAAVASRFCDLIVSMASLRLRMSSWIFCNLGCFGFHTLLHPELHVVQFREALKLQFFFLEFRLGRIDLILKFVLHLNSRAVTTFGPQIEELLDRSVKIDSNEFGIPSSSCNYKQICLGSN